MKKSIQFPYEAHYSVSHEPSGKEHELWLVFHGYGQLAEFFIRKFLPFDSEERLIVAPEGTNYNYLKEFQGRVGANWMTKHEREVAISNNHRYLNLLMEQILEKYDPKPKLHLLGFSQGAATSTRWASQWKGQIETLVLWAGGFAHDLSLDLGREKFEHTKLILAFGDQDELIKEEHRKQQEEMVRALGKPLTVLTFTGGHELEAKLLEKIINHEI
ncbi:alpha/beta hydrolase [Algoriphagus sp. AK58]|uniref:alpha/beta hydrolase n=1 Tax=Algoriphagus sp. AK58 TaxID=1406877 RepID=UPI00164F1D3F|nr:alpha/beta hydrolase [Algoriphagus sp. AK58]